MSTHTPIGRLPIYGGVKKTAQVKTVRKGKDLSKYLLQRILKPEKLSYQGFLMRLTMICQIRLKSLFIAPAEPEGQISPVRSMQVPQHKTGK